MPKRKRSSSSKASDEKKLVESAPKNSNEVLLVPVKTGDFLTDYKTESSPSGSKTAFRSHPKFEQGRFDNPWDSWEMLGFGRVLKFMFSRAGRNFRRPLPSKEVLDRELPVKQARFDPIIANPSPLEITWIGHATVVVRIDGISIITDPIFSDYCAPINFPPTLRRFRDPPCSIADLPDDLRLVVISHNHYDHLDYKSVVDLNRKYGDRLTFCVPKGLGDWFRRNVPALKASNLVELTWWEQATFQLEGSDDLQFRVVGLPAQHWSLRNPIEGKNKSLWGGYCVIGPTGRKFFFAGDTGYCTSFKEIGEELGPVDLAAIPIGAYLPREFLCHQHVDPIEAVKIHCDINAKKSVGVHWGTFRLGGEETLQPRSDLVKAVSDRGLPADAFVTLAHGETLSIPFEDKKKE